MSKDKLSQLTTHEAAEKIHAKEITAYDLTMSCLEMIEAKEPELHSFITVAKDQALHQAKEQDKKTLSDSKKNKNNSLSILNGIPTAIKDVIVTKDLLTTASSHMLNNYIPPYDATAVRALKDQGAVILGKTNCDAFAHGASTENSDYGPTKNPWDTTRVPGGSSGGSAASVAASEAIYALGTDTGGSIRQPAAFCSVVGLKPTYGRVSRYGLISMASSTDCIGPITKDVMDAAIILEHIAGHDTKDSTTSKKPVPHYSGELQKANLKGKICGIPKEFFGQKGMEPGVEKAVKQAVTQFEKLGANIREISLPHTKYGIAVYYVIVSSELSTNLARFDGIRYGHSISRNEGNTKKEIKNLLQVYEQSRSEGFGDEAKRRIMIGTHTLSSGYFDEYYTKASKVRTLIIEDFKKAFQDIDIILTPVIPHTAFKLGAKSDDPLQMYLEDIFVTTVSLAGLPALSLPCGFSEQLPVGLQIIGDYFQESEILQAAFAYEQSTEWHKKRPDIA